MKRILLIYLFIIFTAAITYGQYFSVPENSFEKLTIESGLSQNKVNCILRDKTGYVWIGTGNGLNRFDGKNIQVVEKDYGDNHNLRDIEIFDLFEDKNDEIWIATEMGLFEYNLKFNRINRYLLASNMFREPTIHCIESENDSMLWLGTTDGLKLFDMELGIVTKEYGNIPYEPYTLSNDNINCIYKYKNELWIGTSDGLNKFDIEKGLFKRYFHNVTNSKSIASNSIYQIEGGDNGKLWIGTEFGGLSMYDIVNDSFVNYTTQNSDIPHNDIRDIFTLPNGKMWLATNGGGLALFDTTTNDFDVIKYDPLNPNGLANNSVYVVYEDYEGILWLGFYAGGLNFRTSAINDFKTISNLPGNDNSLCENNVRSLNFDSKLNLWIGTFGGASLYNANKQTFSHCSSQNGKKGALSFNTVTSVLEDKKGDLWIGTYSGGVNFRKKGSTQFKYYRHDKLDASSLSGDNVYAISEDNAGRVWVATASGLNKYIPETDSWELVFKSNVRDILNSDGKLILGTVGGIVIYDVNAGTYEELYTDKLEQAMVVTLEIDNEQKIWFGTQGDGFGCYDLIANEFSFFDISNGLPSNFISSIEKYGENNLWLSTYHGLSLFNKQTSEFVNYGLAEGLPFLEFYPRSSLALPDGTFAFGGSNGIVVFNPDKVIGANVSSTLQFNNFRIDGNTVEITEGSPLKQTISTTNEIKLKYSQNDFSFDFVDINYKSKGLGYYSYILENYMDDWNYIGDQTNFGFTNMDPGEYVLKVRKLGGDPEKGYQDELSMNITIVPPFWMTWYFYLFVCLVIIGVMYLYNKYTLISINQQSKIEMQNLEYAKHEEFNRLRMKFFTYVSHELRTPLSLIIDPLNQLLKNNSDNDNYSYLKLIQSNSERLQKLVNQILDFRKLENDTLSLQVGQKNIGAEVDRIYSSFKQTAQMEAINYRFENNLGGDLNGWIDSDKLEKIMYNLLSNAFKFTRENGEVVVDLQKNEASDKIHILIKDNGFGLKPDKLQRIFEYFYSDEKNARIYKVGVGIGLNYVKRLVDLHHGAITVESELDKGTIFSITLPVLKSEYSDEEVASVSTKQGFSEQTAIVNSTATTQTVKHSKDVPLVLVVEDESELRNYIASRLNKKFRIVQAINGKDALSKVEQQVPDLILSDNVMPVMDGIELCNALKSNEKYRHIPFLFLSAWNSDDFKMKGLVEGAEDYLSKPFNYEILEAKISNIINNRRLLLEVAGQIVKVNPGKIKIDTSDEKFILNAQEVIEKNIDDPDFTTKYFEDALHMSHSVVYRKLKTLTGLSANEFIREFKIRRAAQIISQDKKLSVLDVSLMVGFNDQKYFSRCFKKVMGVSPSEYNA